ncbi:unnamed protein product [Macrosiphum euphorbiae]|uniref:Uncharacterized protein n=1 Tax=Macrosiphum euphorbiae TaxID=13131 RepID=A0AAV0WQ07_9HEMI|nr:unnamed protein product [Macrosiphum euphorbiae]
MDKVFHPPNLIYVSRLEESDRISSLLTDGSVPHQQHSRLPMFSNHLPMAERISLRLIRLGAAAPCNRAPLITRQRAPVRQSAAVLADIFPSTTLTLTGRGHIIIKD